MRQLTRVDGERRGVEALAVEHGGSLPGRAELAGDTLAGVGASFGGELGFHGGTGALQRRGEGLQNLAMVPETAGRRHR